MKSLKEKCRYIMIGCLLIVGCIIVNGCIQKETASGIVSTGKINNITPLSTPVPPVLPVYHTSKNITYEEMKRWEENYTPPSPIPTSEMATIIISKTWFIQNDKNPESDEVQLTFPAKWVGSPIVNDNEEIVLLRVPKTLLEHIDENPDPEMITVSYPKSRFKEFANRNAINLTSQG